MSDCMRKATCFLQSLITASNLFPGVSSTVERGDRTSWDISSPLKYLVSIEIFITSV